MTRFIYLSDSHWGAGELGYHLQPKYDDRLPDLLKALQAWMEENEPVDFLLHGGDMIHETSDAAIAAASAHFDLPVPVHLCLGNHDLTAPDSLGRWERLAPQYFGGRAQSGRAQSGSTNSGDRAACYGIITEEVTIHVIPNQYGEAPFLWDKTQDPHFLPSQVEVLERRLASHADTTQLILTHSPVFGIDSAQTGMDAPFHEPHASFAETVSSLVDRYGVACVLGGHSHANMNKQVSGTNYITVSSFVETPFEFKLFEIDGESMSMETHNLLHRIGFDADYDWDSTFVQGRSCDRSFRKIVSSGKRASS